MTKYYYFGGQRAAIRQGNTRYYLHGDHLGSVSLVTNASGAMVREARYDPWGEVRWSSGAAVTDYGFTGQRGESFGLLDYNARFYNPRLGWFVQPDNIVPLTTQGTQAWDRYAYVNNNPVKYNDPAGHTVPIPYDPCQHGCLIIDMSGWSNEARLVVSAVLDGTLGNLLGNRTGTFEDGQWGILPAEEYYNSGAWVIPPVVGGVVKGTGSGIGTYKEVKEITKGTEKHVHHLIEKRFARRLGIESGDISSIALSKEQHREFTNAWRKSIGYSRDRNKLTTKNATIDDIWDAAQKIYEGSPNYLSDIKEFLWGIK